MIIAREKRKTNIAEYIIYMWEIEDLIRALNLDMDKIKHNIVDHYDQPEDTKFEIENWYKELVSMMKAEGIESGGHMQFLEDIIDKLNNLHKQILVNPKEEKYHEVYKHALPNIIEFRKKINNQDDHDIKICFLGIYYLLQLRLKNEKISKETQEAFSTFSKLLAYLADYFKKEENARR